MSESEQAQTIAEIRAEAKEKREHYKAWNLDTRQSDEVFDLLHRSITVVDSQAQKIAEQAMQIEKLAGLNHVAEAQIERQEMQIAKQAKEIERLKDRLRFEMQPEAKEGL